MKRRSILTHSTRLKPMSSRRVSVNHERRVFKDAYLKNFPNCEVRVTPLCRSVIASTVDLHEPWTRARGGPLNDPRNTMGTCRACHDWIHDNPEMATVRGLLIRSQDGPAWLEAGGVLNRGGHGRG